MATITIKNLAKMQQAFRKAPELARRQYLLALKLSADSIKRTMQNEVPMKTRNLRRSIQSVVRGTKATIGPNLNDAKYALFVHEGTRAYEIRPRTKKALFWKGARHPVKRVHHPGIKPNKFVDRTAQKGEKDVNKIFLLSTRKLLNDIARKSK